MPPGSDSSATVRLSRASRRIHAGGPSRPKSTTTKIGGGCKSQVKVLLPYSSHSPSPQLHRGKHQGEGDKGRTMQKQNSPLPPRWTLGPEVQPGRLGGEKSLDVNGCEINLWLGLAFNK